MTCVSDECRCGRLPCPTPEECITTPDEMLFLTALVGGLAVICIVGLVGWLGYFVWPVLRAYINTF